MANGYNQYIGMRYVPIIDGEWSQSKAYEPLVVVTYNGNSYISKTYAPAGTLPTNETYWILAANYNAQVEQYRQEVRQYQETVSGFSDDIETLQEDVGTNTTAIEGLRTEVDAIGSHIRQDGVGATGVNTRTELCTLAVPTGKWLIICHVSSSVSVADGYLGAIVNMPGRGDTTVRTTLMAGGGCANVEVYDVTGEYENVTLAGISSNAGTLTGRLEAIRL